MTGPPSREEVQTVVARTLGRAEAAPHSRLRSDLGASAVSLVLLAHALGQQFSIDTAVNDLWRLGGEDATVTDLAGYVLERWKARVEGTAGLDRLMVEADS